MHQCDKEYIGALLSRQEYLVNWNAVLIIAAPHMPVKKNLPRKEFTLALEKNSMP